MTKYTGYEPQWVTIIDHDGFPYVWNRTPAAGISYFEHKLTLTLALANAEGIKWICNRQAFALATTSPKTIMKFTHDTMLDSTFRLNPIFVSFGKADKKDLQPIIDQFKRYQEIAKTSGPSTYEGLQTWDEDCKKWGCER